MTVTYFKSGVQAVFIEMAEGLYILAVKYFKIKAFFILIIPTEP